MPDFKIGESVFVVFQDAPREWCVLPGKVTNLRELSDRVGCVRVALANSEGWFKTMSVFRERRKAVKEREARNKAGVYVGTPRLAAA